MREGCEKSLIAQTTCVYAGFERLRERWEIFLQKFQKKHQLILQPSPPKALHFSQLGNVSFPTWECFVPNLGISRSTNRNLSFVLIYSHSKHSYWRKPYLVNLFFDNWWCKDRHYHSYNLIFLVSTCFMKHIFMLDGGATWQRIYRKPSGTHRQEAICPPSKNAPEQTGNTYPLKYSQDSSSKHFGKTLLSFNYHTIIIIL